MVGVVCVCVQVHACVRVQVCACKCVHMCLLVSKCVCLLVCKCVSVCLCVCLSVCAEGGCVSRNVPSYRNGTYPFYKVDLILWLARKHL